MSSLNVPDGVALRPVGASDDAFLRELYASTRAEEMVLALWSEEQKRNFLDFQFRAQRTHYEKHHGRADHDVILCDGERAGRFYVERGEQEINVIDVALLPAFRGRGIATALLSGVIDEAGEAGSEVLIFVEHGNRARNLYERLGLRCSGEIGVYLEMRWRPPREARADDDGRPAQTLTAANAARRSVS